MGDNGYEPVIETAACGCHTVMRFIVIQDVFDNFLHQSGRPRPVTFAVDLLKIDVLQGNLAGRRFASCFAL